MPHGQSHLFSMAMRIVVLRSRLSPSDVVLCALRVELEGLRIRRVLADGLAIELDLLLKFQVIGLRPYLFASRLKSLTFASA